MTLADYVCHCVATERRAIETADSDLEHVEPGLSGGGYLAQHNLLDQLPFLAEDTVTPDVTMCGETGSCRRHVFFGCTNLLQSSLRIFFWCAVYSCGCCVAARLEQ